MSKRDLGLGSRLLIGGIAGIVGTMAMTSAMRRLHQKLPPDESYPLTPREIVDSTARQADVELSSAMAKDITTAAHFAYGAACGSLVGALDPRMRPGSGALAGVAIWLGSYMGWIPAVGILNPATDHPAQRNALMIGVHLVWGAATAIAMRELIAIRSTMIEDGRDQDAPEANRHPNRRAG
jgi:uncharacterized membrane protein YagU involved in acid resistance